MYSWNFWDAKNTPVTAETGTRGWFGLLLALCLVYTRRTLKKALDLLETCTKNVITDRFLARGTFANNQMENWARISQLSKRWSILAYKVRPKESIVFPSDLTPNKTSSMTGDTQA